MKTTSGAMPGGPNENVVHSFAGHCQARPPSDMASANSKGGPVNVPAKMCVPATPVDALKPPSIPPGTTIRFPAEHWKHLRTPKVIESPFATVRLRQRVTKGAGSRTKGLLMAYKLLDMAQARWRRLDGAHLLPLVRAGITFVGRRPARDDGPPSTSHRLSPAYRAAQVTIGHVATAIIVDHANATRKGRMIQTLVPIRAPRVTSWRADRARSGPL
jgi:hypothetical protein